MTTESLIEAACRVYAAKHKCHFVKLKGTTGWPDRLVLLPNGKHMLIEFKKPGGELSFFQRHILHILNRDGHDAYEVDSVPLFKRLLNDRL